MTTNVLAPQRYAPRVLGLAGSLRALATATLYAALGFAAVVLLAVGGSSVFGFRTLTDLSGSMEPGIRPGDLVVDQPIEARDLKVGEIVTFRSPTPPKRLITHRVRRITSAGYLRDVVTKGDANDTVEHWTIPAQGRVGVVRLRVPKLGYAFRYLSGPLDRILTIVLPALLLGAIALRRIWGSEPA